MKKKEMIKQDIPQVIITSREGGEIILRNLYPNLKFYDSIPRDEKMRQEKIAVVLYKKNTP